MCGNIKQWYSVAKADEETINVAFKGGREVYLSFCKSKLLRLQSADSTMKGSYGIF